MELDDLLKSATTKKTIVVELSLAEHNNILHDTFCEYSGKPGNEVQLYLRFRTKAELKALLQDSNISKIYHRKKQEYIASLTSDNEANIELSKRIKDAEDYKIISTVEVYSRQNCKNCYSSYTNYSGTYQILQHKKYYDRRRLLKLEEQITAIYECKTIEIDEEVIACWNCRKSLDSSDIQKQYGSLFGLK